MRNNPTSKMLLLGSLYISQYIPMMFIMMGLPVFLREQEVSLERIGLLSVVALPIALKFLWSPLIDRYSYRPWGHYRFWIIGFQVLAVLVTIGMAFLDWRSHFEWLFGLSLLLCTLCTSQDIATDALAIRLLSPQERGLGNGIQKAGTYLGAIIGSGGVLILLNLVGWRSTQFLVAAITLVMLLPVIFLKESTYDTVPVPNPNIAQIYAPTVNFFRRRGMGVWSLIVIFYIFGSSMIWGMLRPLLVDLGLSMVDIGLMIGIVAFSAGIPAALATGLIVKPLGRKKALIYVGLFQAAALSTYLLPTFGWKSLPVLYAAAIIAQMGMCAAETVICTIAMDNSRQASPGTDYALQNSLMYFSGIFAMVISGFIAQRIGYQGLFLLSVVVSLVIVGAIAKLYRDHLPELPPESMQDDTQTTVTRNSVTRN
jgi:MFS transporter, PAT family, beta-lactamase induction signal transducer AmpG